MVTERAPVMFHVKPCHHLGELGRPLSVEDAAHQPSPSRELRAMAWIAIRETVVLKPRGPAPTAV